MKPFNYQRAVAMSDMVRLMDPEAAAVPPSVPDRAPVRRYIIECSVSAGGDGKYPTGMPIGWLWARLGGPTSGDAEVEIIPHWDTHETREWSPEGWRRVED